MFYLVEHNIDAAGRGWLGIARAMRTPDGAMDGWCAGLKGSFDV
jgi:hypothetical protein